MEEPVRRGLIRAITWGCLSIASIAVGGIARAEPMSFPLILVCSLGGIDGPAVLTTQSSTSLEQACENPSEDDFHLCQSIEAIEPGSSCATALSNLDDVGTCDAVSHSKVFLPSNFRVEIGDLPSTATPIGSRPFERQLDAVYILKSSSSEASLVECDFSASTPRVVGIQSSVTDTGYPPAGATNSMSCADGLQSRFDSGEGVVAAIDVRGWDPIDKETIVGEFESTSSTENAIDSPPDHIIHLYTVMGAGTQ